MNILKLLFLLPLSILSFTMSAQIDDLMRNNDITWIAEIGSDFIVDDAEKAESRGLNRIRTLKKHENDHSFFAGLMYKIYKAQQLKNNLLIVNEAIEAIRVNQILFYNAKNAQFGLRTLGFSPLVKNVDSSAWKSLLWMKARDLENPPDLSSMDIIWARRINQHHGFDLKNAHILKCTDTSMPIQHLLKVFETDDKTPFFKANSDIMPYQSDVYEEEKIKTPDADIIPYPLTLFEREAMIASRDTIIALVDGKATWKVVEHRRDINKINRLRLIQEWYWDDKKQELCIHLAAVAPLYDVCNEVGEFLYRVPLFYRRNDD